jgi:cell division septum initiation protein DivIVA
VTSDRDGTSGNAEEIPALHSTLRVAAARHEAAHAVVSAIAGCVVDLVTIDPLRTAGKRGLCVISSGAFEARLVGIVAARRYDLACGWIHPASAYETDRCAAVAVAALLSSAEISADAVLERAQREADRLLSLPETAACIDAVAAALLASGTLRRRRLVHLVNGQRERAERAAELPSA